VTVARAGRVLPLRGVLMVGAAVSAGALGACSLQEAHHPDSTSAAAESVARGAWNPDAWRPPIVDSTPGDPYDVAVYRGLALVTHTHDSVPAYDPSNLNCSSCHLDEGRRASAIPLLGAYARFPHYMERTGAVIPIEDRINYCFTRSLAGSKLPDDSREMQDIVAYLQFISRDVPTGEHLRAEGLPAMPPLNGDSAHGAALYGDNCARCHGGDGLGMGPIPALWGPNSFGVGASMARVERAASFIRRNMPYDRPGTLTDQEAFDVAAYLTSMPRPDSPGKDDDWPTGGAPADVPYDTKGHVAFHPPPLLPRTGSDSAAIVAAPVSVIRP
jgi:thiosulfate dehydrogenase